ncbi:MAG TPA: NYN domain-containing protein, partial [Candidatus Thermoplasmatota archaeon]|nr:NYN domain-containing protein [Candidatus Thermoplasmatota archaeon]
MSGSRQRVAVLVDGDNANPAHLDAVMAEAARFGVATVKRIYGDWAAGKLNGWTRGLHVHGAQAIQQHNPVSGKNATDGALIIDAMDLLYAGHVDAFCIVASDSDYAALAKRLRASGKPVYGIGEQKTPSAFVRACDEFSYVENLARTRARSFGSMSREGRPPGGAARAR